MLGRVFIFSLLFMTIDNKRHPEVYRVVCEKWGDWDTFQRVVQRVVAEAQKHNKPIGSPWFTRQILGDPKSWHHADYLNALSAQAFAVEEIIWTTIERTGEPPSYVCDGNVPSELFPAQKTQNSRAQEREQQTDQNKNGGAGISRGIKGDPIIRAGAIGHQAYHGKRMSKDDEYDDNNEKSENIHFFSEKIKCSMQE